LLIRIGIVIAPPLLFLMLRLPPYSMNHFQDAVFFHGILADPAEHLRRFGATYYNVRFGAITPEAALWRLLGSEAGYAAFRWIVAALCALALFEGVRSWKGPALGLVAAVAYLMSPITARMLLQTYADICAVSYTLGCLVLLFFGLRTASGPRLCAGLGAGILAGLAVNSNFFAVMPIAAAGPALLILHGRRLASLAGAFLAAAGGFLLVCAIGYFCFKWLYGIPNLFRPTMDAVLGLSSGGSAIWAEKTWDWIADWPFVYVPFLLCIPGIVLSLYSVDRTAKALLAYCATCTAQFMAYDAFKRGYSLKLYWYYSFLLPGIVLATTASISLAADRVRPGLRNIAASGAAAVLMALAVATAYGFLPVLRWHLPLILVFAAAAVAGLGFTIRIRREMPVMAGSLLVLAIAGLLLMSRDDYRAIYMTQYSNDWDAFEAIEDLIRHVPRTDVDPGDIRFFLGEGLTLREMLLQSSFLGPYSQLLNREGQPQSLGSRSEAVTATLCWLRTRFIIGLYRDTSEMNRFVDWLADRQIAVEPFRQFDLSVRPGPLHVTVLRLKMTQGCRPAPETDAADVFGNPAP
jgi:hypothetical protein